MKSLLYLMTAVMAGLLNLSLTACSVDYDGNDYDNPEIIGTWDAVSSQYYAEGEGYSQPGLSTGYWVVTDRTITEYDHSDASTSTAGYTFDGRKLLIDGRKSCEVVTLTQQQMLLRTPVKEGFYKETTYKRR